MDPPNPLSMVPFTHLQVTSPALPSRGICHECRNLNSGVLVRVLGVVVGCGEQRAREEIILDAA